MSTTLNYAKRVSTVDLLANTPPLSAPYNNVAAVQDPFSTGYQSSLASASKNLSGENTAIGDTDLRLAWVSSNAAQKLTVGTTLIVPTGQYNSMRPANISAGNYYTLRPDVEYVKRFASDIAIGVRGTLGFNTKNPDNQLRSGNFVALELAGGYLTSLGPVGAQAVFINQYDADQGGTMGGNRFRSTHAGLFYSTLIQSLGVGLQLNYMAAVQTKNAQSTQILQLRATKFF